MNTGQAIPGSFRDPSGRVYQVNGRIFRTVNHCFASEFDFVDASGLLKRLAIEGIVLPTERVPPDVLGTEGTHATYVLEVPKLPFVSFPYEWPFPTLKAAALLHLSIHLAALEGCVTLSDAAAYNIQFQGAQPVFIDHLSFRRYRPGEIWAGHRQFCEQFLNPLLLRSFFGIPHNAWFRGTHEGITAGDLRQLLKWRHYLKANVLTHIVLQDTFQKAANKNQLAIKKDQLSKATLPLEAFQQMLRKLHRWISTLEPLSRGETVWQEYADTNSYLIQETNLKKEFITTFAQQIKPKLLLDLGCNTGEFSNNCSSGCTSV